MLKIATRPIRPMPSELVVASKPWSISIGTPCVPSRFMLNPQANSPSATCQNGSERRAARTLGAACLETGLAPRVLPTIW
ncbi:hypothetical protein D9M68_761960 [compost metagenome]